MDSIKDRLSNISIYDVKAYVRKAQNVVLNYSEMEAKVREATNNEPWGASSTIMQEISEGTHSYSQFHEIMPMIYKRFTEKTAEEWRQIYKSLQLLEFLVKNGSERVVDYARSHVAVIDMLKHFHYIDSNGKDQGINVRNRAKELLALLGDVNKIRAERKLAKANRSKFNGVSSGQSGGFGNTGNRYGGFGSESSEYGGYSGGVYGDGGGFGGNEYEGPGYTRSSARSHANDDDFEEYQVEASATSSRSTNAQPKSSSKPKPVVDLFSFDDAQPTAVESNDDGDDDFADFQSAAPEQSPTSKPLPSQPKQDPLADLFSNTSSTTSTASQPMSLFNSLSSAAPSSSTTTTTSFNNTNTASFDAFGPLVGASGNNSTTNSFSSPASHSTGASSNSTNSSAPKPKPKTEDAFSSLWTSTKASASSNKTQAPLSSLAQKKAQDQMWGGLSSNSGNGSNSSSSTPKNNNNNGTIDLLSL